MWKLAFHIFVTRRARRQMLLATRLADREIIETAGRFVALAINHAESYSPAVESNDPRFLYFAFGVIDALCQCKGFGYESSVGHSAVFLREFFHLEEFAAIERSALFARLTASSRACAQTLDIAGRAVVDWGSGEDKGAPARILRFLKECGRVPSMFDRISAET